MTRGEIEESVADLFGSGQATLIHRGLARVLEDRSEFEVVSEVDPEQIREKLFSAAALYRTAIARKRRAVSPEQAIPGFQRDQILAAVAKDLEISPAQLEMSLFADLKDENRLLQFDDITAQRLIDRYNVALAQSILLRATRLQVEIRMESPARLRRIFQMLKFHRLLFQATGQSTEGLNLTIEGPMSLFQSTTKYGLQMALWLPSLLNCRDFRLDADLLWGTKKELRTFHLEKQDGLVSHLTDSGAWQPPEFEAFLNRFRQIAPTWSIQEAEQPFRASGVQGLHRIWMPDFQLTHLESGRRVFLEILGFWRNQSFEQLLEWVPEIHGLEPLWAVSDKWKVDEGKLQKSQYERVVSFRDIPNAMDILTAAEKLVNQTP
jgi:predicted nuclease of restriction endonuclease-like RecB superfamily